MDECETRGPFSDVNDGDDNDNEGVARGQAHLGPSTGASDGGLMCDECMDLDRGHAHLGANWSGVVVERGECWGGFML